MLWSSSLQLDNMDEQEQADRMAAAEALYMISTRVDKSGAVQKTPRRGRKKKNSDYNEDTSGEMKGEHEKNGGEVMGSNNNTNTAMAVASRRGGGRAGKRVVHEGRADGGGGRGGGKGASSSRKGEAGKSRSSTRNQQRQSSVDEKFQRTDSSQLLKQRNSTGGGDTMFHEHVEHSKRRSRSRTPKKINQRKKSNSPSSIYDDYTQAPSTKYSKTKTEEDHSADSYLAIGFTGAAISINESNNRRSSIDSSPNLQSQAMLSGFRQVNLPSRSLPSTTMYGLPSMNLTSFTSELNLPSIPLEIGSLQLSSQPTPNLSSLGDLADSILEAECTSADRKKFEKFLPLKKRKLLNSSEAEVSEPTLPMDASSISDSEERSEPQSPPPQKVEPVRASFTVQAPPIITMHTLMEIKTALNADDDGDLPLHIAVVHENMRMVIKLINLMRIAGKGVDKFNKQQQTPLHLAVKLNFLEAVDILLKSNANVNAVDCTGSSCIHMAVQGRSIQCLTLLLERCLNADLNVRNFDGLTPLHIAVDNGDLQQVESLLKFNADIDVTNYFAGLDGIICLAIVNQDGKSGRTALFRAAESNQKAMVELLLNKGANPDVPNYAGVTTAMAAQGRNLHGVLKLLGSVATDKFTEYETKPTVLALESKVTPLYLGFPSTDNVAISHNSQARGIKHTNPEIMCLIEPKVSKETAEMSSNETKVFHNVFVVSQGQSKEKNKENKSMSEPSSPEVKMDVTEEKDRERYDRSGLMSLPEGILCHSEDDRGDKLFVRQGNVTTVRQGESLSPLQARYHLPAGYSKVIKNSVPVVQKEQKSVMLQIVPQPSSASVSNTLVGTLISTTNTVSSNILSKLSYLSTKPVFSTPSTTLSSSATPLTNLPVSSSDTVTLTSNQARLFQMLLKMYNIDQSSNVSAGSSVNRLNSSPISSVFPKSTLSQSSSLSHPTISPSITSLYQKQVTLQQSYIQQTPKNVIEPVVSSHEKDTGSGISSQSCIQVPLSQHKLTETGRGNYDHSSDNTASKDRVPEKAEESPLNLSTTSNRQKNKDTDGRGSSTLHLRKSENPDCNSSPVHLSPSSDRVKGGVKAGLSPVQQGSVEKVISIEVLRIPDGDNKSKVNADGDSQIEMLILPTMEQKDISATVSSGQLKAADDVTIPVARTVQMSDVSQDNSTAKLSEHKLSGQVITPVLTSVPQKTTSIVRNYLSHQNISSVHKQPTASAPQSSVPTVLDFAAETRNLNQKKQVMALTRNPFTTATMGKATQASSSPVSTTILWPAVSSNPIFLHQGQVIDLSRGKVTERNTSTPKFTTSLLNPETGQEKIIGFSGAILSVLPSKLETVDRPNLPKEPIYKEILKKRGRKCLKSLQGFPLLVESGLGKINSETDEKLKKFLDAKKLENAFSVLPDNVDGIQDEQTNGIDIEEHEALGTHPESGLSQGQVDKTYKTVGIFSGNVQHVKVGRKFNMSPTHGNLHTAPLSLLLTASSQDVLCSLGNISSDSSNRELDTEGSIDHSENIGVNLSKFVAATDVVSKHVTLETSSESSLKTSDTPGSNGPNCNSSGTKISEDTTLYLSMKSKRPRKPSSYVVTESKEKIASMFNKKGKDSQSDSEIGRFKFSKIAKKSLPLITELDSNQGQKINAKSLFSSILLQTMKTQEENLCKSNNKQTISSDIDAPQKLNKRQRRKKSGPQGIGQIHKSVPVDTNKPHPLEGAGASAKIGTNASSNVDIMKAIPADRETSDSQ